MCVCAYICIYIYICLYICIYIHIYAYCMYINVAYDMILPCERYGPLHGQTLGTYSADFSITSRDTSITVHPCSV